ncbi:hypothetical protein D9611_008929 [Ephemerocybe angulata]|uniref:F-box domain-containing protein n=1 Tax=Ephemerocybe angulata TaxID=980116 RepID=A0A8H5BYW7_9AGAR|nr:hypothetical protein D9611_008929 [Tulosesus angulatus]
MAAPNTTPIPDLPPELWLEILYYLPRVAIYKMMCINRLLFNLAMQYKYEEICFITDDKGTLRTFEQLHHYENASRLVRRLYLRPAFLPGMDDTFEDSSVEDGLGMSQVTSFTWLSDALAFRLKTSPLPHHSTDTTAQKALVAAASGLPRCTNLREITLIIYDHVITPEFREFLRQLWKRMGPGIQKLTIATTINKAPDLLKMVREHSRALPNLDSLDITIAHSRFPQEKGTAEAATSAIVNLVNKFKKSITHLTLSASIAFDFSAVLRALNVIPMLQKLELWYSTPGSPELTRFLHAHNDTLEHLVLQPRPRFHCYFSSGSDEILGKWILSALPTIILPKVKILDVGLQQKSRNVYNGITTPIGPPLPPLLPIFPKLNTLTLTSSFLNLNELSSVLEVAQCQLESLSCHVWTFTPEMLACLVSKAPRLNRLNLMYDSVEARDGSAWESTNAAPDIYTRIQAVRYPQWPLKYLRIGRRISGGCGQCHPDAYLADLLQHAISMDLVVDREMECGCDGRYWSNFYQGRT